MRPLVVLALAASLSLVGCLEEERTITLEPDGRGTLRLVRTLGKEPSGMVLRLDMDRASVARRFAAEQLAEVQGVVAWTDVVAEVTSDDRLHVAATGWFEDVTALGHATPMAEQKPFVVVERDGSTWRVSMPPNKRDAEALEGADLDEALESLRKIASGLRHETVVVVPGDVVDASGWRRDGRVLRCVLDEAGVLAATEGLPAGREGLEELVRRLDALVRAEATVTVPAATPSDDFTQRLRAAVAAWEGSPWREAVERERAKAVEAEEEWGLDEGDEGDRAPRPAAPPDRFEPNDEPEAARPIEPGRHDGLVAEADADDWYSVTVPAGHELNVRVDGPRGEPLQLVLSDPSGDYIANDFDARRALRVRLVAGDAARRALVGVLGGEHTPYALQVDVARFEPADRFEPNDDEGSAAALPLGAHADLALDAADWYRLDEALAGKRLEVRLRRADRRAELSMIALPFDDDEPLGWATTSRDSDEAVMRFLVPEDGLLLHVEGDDDARYTLTVAEFEVVKDALEPNDTPDQARPLGPGSYQATLESDDWYRVELAPGKRLRVRAGRTGDVEGDLELSVRPAGAPDEVQARTTALVGLPAELTIARRAPGPYLVRVVGKGVIDYALELVEEPFKPEDAFEPNDVAADAAPLAAGVHEARAGNERQDWYSIEVPAGARLKVVLAAHRELVLHLTAHGVGDDEEPEELAAGGEDDDGDENPPTELTIDPAPTARTIRLSVRRYFSSSQDKGYRLEVAFE